jgi:hypothetical protein
VSGEDKAKIAESLQRFRKPIAELREDPENARLHSEESVKAIAASLRAFGQQRVIVALKDGGRVVAGNGTLRAARSLGWLSIAAVVFKDEAKARAYALADNRTSELSTWDSEVLRAVREELGAGPVDELMAWDEVVNEDIFNLSMRPNDLGGGPSNPIKPIASDELRDKLQPEKVPFVAMLSHEEQCRVERAMSIAQRHVTEIDPRVSPEGAQLRAIAEWYNAQVRP